MSDSDLLTRTQDLAGKSNELLAVLLDHLAEVEARGLHRQRACSSLYTYCIYELRFSEDAAARRSSAAKLARRFPAILAAVAAGEIHLTGLLLLGPHLTDENHLQLLSLAKFRTKKEVSKLIRRLAPLPLVPDRVEPLGALAPAQPNPTWSEFIESLCPPIRELHARNLSAANRDDSIRADGAIRPLSEQGIDLRDPPGGASTAPARCLSEVNGLGSSAQADHDTDQATRFGSQTPARPRHLKETCDLRDSTQTGDVTDQTEQHGSQLPAPARCLSEVCELGRSAQPGDHDQTGRFGSQTRAPARCLSEVGELGRSAQPGDHDQAGRFGSQTPAPARCLSGGAWGPDVAQLYLMQFTTAAEHAGLVERARALLSHGAGKVSLGELHLQAMRLLVKSLEKRRFGSEEGLAPQSEAAVTEIPRERRQRSRYIPARLRRAVYERDQRRCAYVDERGVRCGEAHRLEVHHLRAFALGGVHELQNLSLRCKAHNTLAAEQDFGREYVAHQRERSRHKPERDAKGR
ncbi:MAG TPA: hypothetical protein VG937_31380 [Polyangiaceae bacterium]|nr:hypothetical protein [Polyangiaceae bacterium]